MHDNGLGELERLTNGETFLISRRRHKKSQLEAARDHGVTYTAYSKWERDIGKVPRGATIRKLKPHERCLLYRRRSKKRQEDVANELGCCKYTLRLMEQGEISCDTLLWHWEQ